ncbi:MAG: SOS response-associated peptidase family protein [Hydrogenophaga sp.]|uniref:SOS response-associated peptidase n=1 Tax=Hydrogenophaga sp. TaxID=1904254 RepID=UPI002721AE3A|nr:SOS response-associated peptidase family protein [Hydrogenophaga sp.]MDO9482128.1 SOS response-associated peptidase family protein [Hydrogenophaga sp.]MDP3346835.1 SOS response-associated peptidase family protein [Hydrogenophaga sp.]MDP3806777.1 SOS response-associated peptidase family protein [Hydrogenophaga sp.]
MSSQYESLQPAALYPDAFNVAAPETPVGRNVWPRQPGVFIRKAPAAAAPAPVPEAAEPDTPDAQTDGAAHAAPAEAAPLVLELVAGQFGFVPTWVKSASDAKLRSTKLVNARSETVSTSKNFYDAWAHGQRCIVPMMAFIEDDYRSGKAVPTRIARVDGKPMGVAGLWECWTGADGQVIVSFTLLTVNANSHALMNRYQQPGSEKRMPAVLNEGAYGAWLTAHPQKAKEFMRAYPANWLTANPVQKK